jgi:protoheme IX farnesyltransferase
MTTTAIDSRSIAGYQAHSWKEWSILVLQLGKIKISLLTTLSAAAGYVLATGKITIQMLVPTAAVFLLACGSCALNQYQEREIDQLMERTKSRPIPSGKLNPEVALWISAALILSGSLTLFYGAKDLVLGLGLLAVLSYNLLYTPLKQKTAFAAVPGAFVGAIPPALGWVAGGGGLLDPQIWGIALFFFMWQIPHFWLLLLDFSKDYEKAGLPSITKIFTRVQIKRIVFVWLLSTGVSSLVIPLFGFFNSSFLYLLLVAAVAWFFWNAVFFLMADFENTILRTTFTKLNLFVLLVLFPLSLDKMLAG